MGASLKTAKQLLAERVAAALGASGKVWSNESISVAAKKAGKEIGRTSVDRVRKAEGNPTLDNIEAIALALGLQPWELLHPSAASADEQKPPSLAQAIEVVGAALAALPTEKRQTMLGVLGTYSTDPHGEARSLGYLIGELSQIHPGETGPLGAPIALDKKDELEELSKKAEERHGHNTDGKRSRASK